MHIEVINEELGERKEWVVTIMRHRIDPECAVLDVYHGS
jgi:hypothetical protein